MRKSSASKASDSTPASAGITGQAEFRRIHPSVESVVSGHVDGQILQGCESVDGFNSCGVGCGKIDIRSGVGIGTEFWNIRSLGADQSIPREHG